MSTQVAGVAKLLKKFDTLSKAAKNKIGKKAITTGVKQMARVIKKAMPSRWKGARKAIGYGFKRPRSGKWKNLVFAKAGVGAGMKKAKRAKMSAAIKEKGRGNRKGVGIGVGNLHWFLLGTENRMTGFSRSRIGGKRGGRLSSRRRGRIVKRRNANVMRFTGRLEANGLVKTAVRSSAKVIEQLIIGEFVKGVLVEARK